MDERAARDDRDRPGHKYWVPSVGFWVVVAAGVVAVTCAGCGALWWTVLPPLGPEN